MAYSREKLPGWIADFGPLNLTNYNKPFPKSKPPNSLSTKIDSIEEAREVYELILAAQKKVLSELEGDLADAVP
jgi:hypothetical protein